MRLAVTGADGFVGAHVVDLAVRAGHEVHAIHRSTPVSPRHGVAATWAADLTESWPVDADLDGVIHLAGLAAVGASFDAPQRYIGANTAILTTLGEALLGRRAASTRVVVVSTGALYAPGAGSCSEQRPIAMTSPYAVSKAAVELQSEYYRTRGLDVIVARPFNHIGPGQARGFIVPDLTYAVSSLGEGDALEVGNLDTRRDYTDVRDVADAYLTMLSADSPAPLYNVASGTSVSGREILEQVCHALGRAVPPTVVDPARMRPNDPAEIIGDAGRLRRDLGWAPRIDLKTSIADFVGASTR